MLPTKRNFRLEHRQTVAAHLLVEDKLTDEQIAAEVGISRQQLWRWKRTAKFRKTLRDLGKKFDAEVVQIGVASKRGRLESLLDQYRRMQLIVDERAADPTMVTVPGGRSGLLVRQYRMIGSGPASEKVEEFAFDASLHREMRELKRQIAVECGQWVEKVAPTNPEGDREYGELTESERIARLAALFETGRSRRDRQTPEGENEVGVESGSADSGSVH